MAYTAQQLITRAWYLSGIVARQAQTVSGDQITDGLFLLNSLLNWKQVETDLIPYWTYNTSMYTVPGQEAYFIPNCVEIQCVTFNIGVLRYPMDYSTNRVYFGSGRVDNISTLPFNWTFTRELGGGNLYLYFLPQDAYQLKIFGKFFLTNVVLTTDLATVYDTSYIEYLRYALAEYMCSEWGIIFSPQSEKILRKIERELMYVSPPDLSMIKTSVLTNGSGYNYGDINLGRGWRPS